MAWPLPLITGESTHAAVASRVVPAINELRALEASATEPTPTVAYQLWMDTVTGVLKQRNSANSAWITLFGVTAGGITLEAADGYRQTVDGWATDNASASMTDVAMARLSVGAAFPNEWIAPRPGSVTGVTVKSNSARVAGTLTVTVFKNGVSIGLSAVLDGANTTFHVATQAKDVDAFVAGDELDVRVTTDAGWLPSGTPDIRASIEVET